MTAKILLFDVETAPALAYIWELHHEVNSMTMVKEDWYMLCWSAKWLHSKEVMTSSLIDFPRTFKRNRKDDSKMLIGLRDLMDEADILIAHNGIEFDKKKATIIRRVGERLEKRRSVRT